MKRIQFKKVKLNTKLSIDAGISALLVNVGPGLLNKFVFSSSPLTGVALNGASVGLCYVASMLTKKPDIFSIGTGLAVTNLIATQIPDLIGVSDYQMIPNAISDYTDSAAVVNYDRYSGIYGQN